MRTISTNFLNLKFENLCKNESFSKTIFACLTGAQGGSIHEKNYKKILWNYHFEYINQNAVWKVLFAVWKVIPSERQCQKLLLSITDMFVIDHKEKLSLINHKTVVD